MVSDKIADRIDYSQFGIQKEEREEEDKEVVIQGIMCVFDDMVGTLYELKVSSDGHVIKALYDRACVAKMIKAGAEACGEMTICTDKMEELATYEVRISNFDLSKSTTVVTLETVSRA